MAAENTTGDGNALVIQTLLEKLRRLGVREYCVAAGARNAAIIAALYEAEPANNIRHFFEERSAAFFALGRTIELRQPVAVVITSGTAAAELLPAMIEAYYQSLPLVAVTADRPGHYAGSGAPQAIEQKNLFGIYATESWDMEWRPTLGLVTESEPRAVPLSTQPGPIHFNVRLEEGLPSTLPSIADAGAILKPQPQEKEEPANLSASDIEIWRQFCTGTRQTVVLAGGLHPADALQATPILQSLQQPIIAETTANLHGLPSLEPLFLQGGEMSLKSKTFGRVLRIGSVPSWRWWRDLEDRPDVQVLNISRTPFRGLARTCGVHNLPWHFFEHLAQGSVSRPEGSTLDCREANRAQQHRLQALFEVYPKSEPAWIYRLSLEIGAEASVFLGNSLPIREWNLAAAPSQPGTAFYANRGANGIDGLLSTWLGLSASARESWCIVGDLSTLYDLSAPWILRQLPAARRRLVIINNRGGKIFSRVAWLSRLPEPVREIIENRHEISFASWASMWGAGYRRLSAPEDLLAVDKGSDFEVWEVQPDARETDQFWDRFSA